MLLFIMDYEHINKSTEKYIDIDNKGINYANYKWLFHISWGIGGAPLMVFFYYHTSEKDSAFYKGICC